MPGTFFVGSSDLGTSKNAALALTDSQASSILNVAASHDYWLI